METRARRGEHGGRYRVVDAHDSHVAVRTSVDGIIETVSPEVTALLGWRPDDWVGRKPFEFVHPDDLMVAQQAHTDVNRGRTVQLVTTLSVGISAVDAARSKATWPPKCCLHTGERGIVARVREVLETGTPFVAEGLRSYNDLLGEHRLYDITLIPVDGVVSMWHRDVTDRYHQFDVEARMQSQDAIIRDLRTTVYQLGTTRRSTTPPDRSVHDTVVEATRALGFDPQVTVDPDVSVVSDTTLGHLLLVMRELLSNVARHARAHRVEVDVYLVGSDVVLGVWDDGVGLPALPVSGNGLTNVRRRAQLWGGGCEVRAGRGDGTEVIWRVPARAG